MYSFPSSTVVVSVAEYLFMQGCVAFVFVGEYFKDVLCLFHYVKTCSVLPWKPKGPAWSNKMLNDQ